MANIGKNRPRWDRMDKNDIPIPSLLTNILSRVAPNGKHLQPFVAIRKNSAGSSSGVRTQPWPFQWAVVAG